MFKVMVPHSNQDLLQRGFLQLKTSWLGKVFLQDTGDNIVVVMGHVDLRLNTTLCVRNSPSAVLVIFMQKSPTYTHCCSDLLYRRYFRNPTLPIPLFEKQYGME